jgi:DNA-binding NarL/FixJ family response regulator
MAPIRVLLLGDDPLARGGLAALLGREPSVEVTGQARLDEVAEAVEAARPEVVCWDPGGDGEPASRLVAAVAPAPLVALLGAGASAAALLHGGVRGLLDR